MRNTQTIAAVIITVAFVTLVVYPTMPGLLVCMALAVAFAWQLQRERDNAKYSAMIKQARETSTDFMALDELLEILDMTEEDSQRGE